MGNCRQIGAADKRRIALAAGAAADHKGLAKGNKTRGHRRFNPHLVDGVNHKIKRQPENFVEIVFADEVFDFAYRTFGIDAGNPLGQGADFGLAEIRA